MSGTPLSRAIDRALRFRAWYHDAFRDRTLWLSAGAGAATLWALFWILCTPENQERLIGDPEGHPPVVGTRRVLANWLTPWTRQPPETEWPYPLRSVDPHLAVWQIALTALLFALVAAWALRTLPPTRRHWPLTLASCWAVSIAATMVTTVVLAPFRETNGASLWVLVAWYTGDGAPLAAVFGLPAAGVVVGAAALLRRGAERAGRARPVTVWPAPGRRAGVLAAGAAAVPVALALAALGNERVLTWALVPGEDRPLPAVVGLLRWLLPGIWSTGSEVFLFPSTGTWLVLFAVLQPPLSAGLFWLALRRLPRWTLPGVLFTAVWTGVLAVMAVGVAAGLSQSSPRYDWPVISRLAQSLGYVPGAISMGLLGGLAAWLVLRRADRSSVVPDRGPDNGGDEPPAPGPAPGGRYDGPDDELVITVSR